MKANFRKIIAAGLSVVSLLAFHQISFADGIEPEITFSNETGMVTIKGGENITAPSGKVTIEILYPEKTSGDLTIFDPVTDKQDPDEVIRYLAEITAGADGSFEHSFDFSADTGDYPIRIYFSSENRFFDDELNFISYEQIMNIIAQINEEPSRAEELIEANMFALALQSDAYDALKSVGGNLSAGYDKLAKDVPFADVAALGASFNKGMLIECFNSSVQSSVLAGLADENMSLVGFDKEDIYEDYLKLSDSEKKAAMDKIERSGHEDLSDVCGSMIKSSASYILMNTSVWNQIAPKAEKYAGLYSEEVPELKDIDFSAYNSLSSERKSKAMLELMGKQSSIDTLSKWVSEFNAVCKKWKDEPIDNPGSSGGGGHGSGSSSNSGGGVGGTSAGTPNIPNNNNNNQNNDENEVKFTDLGNAPWASEAIVELAKRGVISGRSEEIFDTQSNVTREEFIKILVSAFDLIEDREYASDFVDVDAGAWYFKYVACAEELGITSGNGDGMFGTGRSITREEMAAMLLRTLDIAGVQLKDINEEIVFIDSDDISPWAQDACRTLQKAGIISGMDNGSFEPKASTTRAQAAVVVYKTLLNNQ